MKKIVIFLLVLTLALCILPCYAEQAPISVASSVDGASDAIIIDADYVETTERQPSEDNEFIFTPANFVPSLSYMGIGMAGIFIVIGLIVLSTLLLNRLFRGKSEGEKQ